MIDHVSVGVRELESAREFYGAVLSILGMSLIMEKPGTVGFGKKYPEIWINSRPGKELSTDDNGTHICFRAKSVEAVNSFYAKAIECGATSSGMPGYRDEYHAPAYRDDSYQGYYAAFIRDADQNHIEVVTFL